MKPVTVPGAFMSAHNARPERGRGHIEMRSQSIEELRLEHGRFSHHSEGTTLQIQSPGRCGWSKL